MLIPKNWKEYEAIDIGEGFKIERFGSFVFKRPEPTATGKLKSKIKDFDGMFEDGKWIHKDLPNSWILKYKDMKFNLSPSSFKHLGIFPEQAVNWDFIRDVDEKHQKPMRILNLFAYTGGATIAAAMGNVEEVVHIDALKSAITRTQENIQLNQLEHKTIRTMVDDVLKFVQKEKRRGNTYHAIIMDPPSFGRGPKGEIFKIEDQIDDLLDACLDILDKEAVYFILNTYSSNLPHKTVETIMKKHFKKHHIYHGSFDSHKLGVPVKEDKQILKLGNTTRWCIYEDLLRR